MTKDFAIGEILTAQDVNEHLVNRITRTILTGTAVFTPASGITVSSAQAIIDTDRDGNAAITVVIDLAGANLPNGNQTTTIGTLAPALRPTAVGALHGFNSSRSLIAAVVTTGVITVRWTSAAMPSGGTVLAGSLVRVAT